MALTTSWKYQIKGKHVMKKSCFDWNKEDIAAFRKSGRRFRLALLHMSHEGQMIRTGGVGTVIHGHLSVTPMLAHELAKHGIDIAMHTTQPIAKPGCEGWNPKSLEYLKAQVAKVGGSFTPIINGTDGTVRWGDESNWTISSAAAASWALNLATQYDAAIVYCHSFPFSMTPIYGRKAAEAFGADAFFLQVNHGHYEKPEDPQVDDPWKMAYAKLMPVYRTLSHMKMGDIGEYMRKLAMSDFGLKDDDFIPCLNGIDPFQPIYRKRTEAEKIAKLKEYGISLDRPIVLSWGRPEIWKGHQWVLEAGAKLTDVAETVVISSPETAFLRDAHRRTGEKCKMIFKFDSELVNSLLQWHNTKVAALVSKGEPFGMTVTEARLGARFGGPLVVVSDTGGMTPQVIDGVDGFHVKTGDSNDMARVFRHVVGMSAAQMTEFRQKALDSMLSQYTWPMTILQTWAAVCPIVADVAAKVADAVRVRPEQLAD